MKVLISTIGSRGEVQPIIGLALALRSLGHGTTLVVPTNFTEWVESFGLSALPIGPDLKKLTGGTMPAAAPKPPSMMQRRYLAAHTIREQFQLLGVAARDCDLIVGAGALQFAARSIAEAFDLPYVFAVYCPATLASPDHPPPQIGSHHSHSLPKIVNRFLWKRDERRWNDLFRATVDDERAKIGLCPIAPRSFRSYAFTERPWLATDPMLGPAGRSRELEIVQTGAWLLSDRTALPEELENFLAAGEPPIYFGFGSMRTSADAGRIMIAAARALGRRSIISQGWANLGTDDAGSDCLTIGDVNHELLFPRVAAVVHHGGAGTTTTAARAGTVQVIVPHMYDQYYWAHRVRRLRIGVANATREQLTTTTIVDALRECFHPEMIARARSLAARIEGEGAQIAARRLNDEFAGVPRDASVVRERRA